MNTQNKPDRAEVIAEVKEWISNGKITLVGLNQSSSQTKHMRSRIDLLSSALQLLEQDGEDGKRLDWLEWQAWADFSSIGGYSIDSPNLPSPTGGETYRAAISYAMESTSTTEEESA